jgi:hypothetical protein
MRLFLVLLLLLLYSLSAAYVDKIYISLRQCLCLEPQWLYLDVKAHISSTGDSPLNLTLQWFDGGWGGACLLGPGPDVYNICSVPRSSSAVALVLYQNGREVDRVEIWGLRPVNASCVAVPELRVLNKTTQYEPPLAVVTVKSTMVRNMTAYFQASGYTAARSISIRGLNPCDDYVVKLFYYLPSPSPWRIAIYGDLTTVLTTTETVTTTATATKVVTSTVTVEKTTTATVTTTVTITETRAEEHTATVTHTVTGVEVVREVDLRGVVLAFLGVAMLGVSLIIFIISEKRRRV